MAMGEFVSVNTQKDSQRHAISLQKAALNSAYDNEFNTVQHKLMGDGISTDLAHQATKEMMTKDPVKTTVRQKYGFNVGEYTNPLSAAIASMISFPTGSILPLLAITMFQSHPNSSTLSLCDCLGNHGIHGCQLGMHRLVE